MNIALPIRDPKKGSLSRTNLTLNSAANIARPNSLQKMLLLRHEYGGEDQEEFQWGDGIYHNEYERNYWQHDDQRP